MNSHSILPIRPVHLALPLIHPVEAPRVDVRAAFGLPSLESLQIQFEVRKLPSSSQDSWSLHPATDTQNPCWELWEYDVVELFLAAPDFNSEHCPHYFEFQIAPDGKYFELEIHEPRKRTNRNFRSGCQIRTLELTPNHWRAELTLDLTRLGYSDQSETLLQQLQGGLFAALGPTSNRHYYAAFLPIQDQADFHLPKFFEQLIPHSPAVTPISAETAVDTLLDLQTVTEGQRSATPLIDVRSEGEATITGFEGTPCFPLLNNQERHEIGTCYKAHGQEAAIQLGHRLVEPVRERRVYPWKNLLEASHRQTAILACWRGGLRSQISASWLHEETGRPVHFVRGGTKAMRAVLLEEILNFGDPSKDLRPLFVLSGLTGSGKTDLLHLPSIRNSRVALDLEGIAHHRGSSFGRIILSNPQPHQTVFENSLGLAIRAARKLVSMTRENRPPPLILEDESRMIGDLRLPDSVVKRIQNAPVIEVISTLEERVQRIISEYIAAPIIERELDSASVEAHFLAALKRIQKALGRERMQMLQGKIHLAFQRSQHAKNQSTSRLATFAAHTEWVEILLKDYYDRYYSWTTEHLKRPVVFRGSIQECEHWILSQTPRG